MIELALSFVAVVKANSFSSAAKKVGISKAQLSRQIRKLEDHLGIQLLYRTTRKLALTESGKEFYEACYMVEEDYADAVANLKCNFSTIQGNLRITAPIDFGIEVMPNILHKFSELYPKINIILSLSNENQDLTDKDYHLAFRISNRLPDSDLKMIIIKEFKRIICAAPEYFTERNMPKNLDDLKAFRCITSVNHDLSAIKPQWAFYQNSKIVKFDLNSVIEADSLLAQIKLILLGSGIGRMPDYFIKQQLSDGRLIEVFPDIDKPSSFVYLLYPNQRVLPKKTRVFIDFVKGLSAQDKLFDCIV